MLVTNGQYNYNIKILSEDECALQWLYVIFIL